ncbi:MAG: bifunctional DNA primase/polymerase, partial [Chloroflexi bacterium]|nr:bifunctional DNA primase/polymerase [Chloroflexota bacterium]
MTTPIEIAQDFLRREFAPLPLPFKSKIPVLVDWPNLRLTADQLPDHFNGAASNIGIITGAASGNAVDVDCDWPEARDAAAWFLPKTSCVFGRKSSRRGHSLYRVAVMPAYKKYEDPTTAKGDNDKACIIEFRGDDRQTMAPGSVHPSGELVEWEPGCDGDPTHVDGHQLYLAVSRIAACALLARHWPKGSRQDAAMHLAGGLLRAEWEPDKVR